MRPERARTRRAAPAFTLVELLVSITIILVLIGILIPALGTVRDRARSAATDTLSAAVIAAATQFEADNQRLPGVFTQRQLAGVGGSTNEVQLTATENAILDLAGGVVDDAADSDLTIELSDEDGNEREVEINTALIGSTNGPGYLDVGEGVLQPVDGQVDDPVLTSDTPRLPDLIDPFGLPLLLWQRNEFAPPEAPLGGSEDNPQFLFSTNNAYLFSRGLGRRNRNQLENSLLVPPAASGESVTPPLIPGTSNTLDTFLAVIGNPAFPVDRRVAQTPSSHQLVPGQARGSFILQSAGKDGIYLDDRGGDFDRVVYVGSDTDFDEVDIPSNGILLDSFDDIIRGGGS